MADVEQTVIGLGAQIDQIQTLLAKRDEAILAEWQATRNMLAVVVAWVHDQCAAERSEAEDLAKWARRGEPFRKVAYNPLTFALLAFLFCGWVAARYHVLDREAS